MSVKKQITIDEELYNELVDRDAFLTALEAAGVDNWNGYDYAIEYYEESKNDE